MKPLNIQILYEYGVNKRPHASASLRLIRPLTHPSLSKVAHISVGTELGFGYFDLIMVDRLWKPDIKPEIVYKLRDDANRRGARLVYWFDDHFEAMWQNGKVSENQWASFQAFLAVSDFLVVSSEELRDVYQSKGKTIFLPSVLDERLIVRKQHGAGSEGKVVIGYMGTATHDNDLEIILPALTEVKAVYGEKVRFEFVGVADREKLASTKSLDMLKIHVRQTRWWETEYPLFMVWFTENVDWDIGLAPLANNSFNRCKSDIKYLDYSAAGIPGIFSDLPTYSKSVDHFKTGLLAQESTDSWLKSIVNLIEDEELRKNFRRSAINYLFNQRVMRKRVDSWLDLLEQLSA